LIYRVVMNDAGHHQHTAAADILRQFHGYDHLPEPHRGVSDLFHVLATELVFRIPESPALAAGLRKLLTAREACVHASLEAGGQ
jgi:hypothetical protein